MSEQLQNLKLRDLYAYIGYTLFLSQALEGLLAQAIFAFVVFPAKQVEIREIAKQQSFPEWEAFVDENDEQLRRSTMGTLMKRLRGNSVIPTEVEKALAEALKQRNFLAHEFFREKLASLYTETELHESSLLVRRAGGSIQLATDLLLPIVRAEMGRHGYDEKYVEEYARNALDKACSTP